MKKQYINYLGLLGIADAAFGSIFEHMLESEKERYPHERLGDGYELRAIELKDSKGNEIPNNNKYSHLYFEDKKVCNKVFRRGGFCGDFEDGYSELIYYTKVKGKAADGKEGFDSGTFVIINTAGDIVLEGGKFFDHPRHIGGHLGSLKDYIYDLRTGKVISVKSSTMIKGVNSIIIEHRYNHSYYEHQFDTGVYSIDLKTAEVTKLDEIK